MPAPVNPNPWSYEGWNVTGQGVYLRQHGEARADARARDAGTYLGGPQPNPPLGTVLPGRRIFGEVAVVRPENPPIYRFMIPPKRDDIRVTDVGDVRVTDTDDERAYKD